jgi:hypothetical protein
VPSRIAKLSGMATRDQGRCSWLPGSCEGEKVCSRKPGDVCCQAFEGFNVVSNDGRTSLIADLDQAALYGVLIRIQSLGLELMELARIPSRVG